MSYGTVQAEKMTTESGFTLGAGNASSFKNRLINGAMTIDQRNNGASVTSSSGGTFSVDRFSSFANGGGVYTTQQSTDVPTGQGFINSIVNTVTTTDSPTGTDYYIIQQNVEGFNMLDFGWGTASAKSVTVSFWVKSSLTGLYTVAFRNNALNRAYRATYTINSANTWEQKTITVPGDTTGTWLTNSSTGLRLGFTLGAGSDYIDTGNVWSALEDFAATGQTQWISTNGATFYLTGIQLEIGTVATSFDFRPYGTEFGLCCRYYYKNVAFSTYSPIGVGRAWSGTQGNAPFFLPVPMRANQTVTYSALTDFDIVTLGNPSSIGNDGSSMNAIKIGWSRGSGVVSGNLYQIEYGNTTSAWLAFSAEL